MKRQCGHVAAYWGGGGCWEDWSNYLMIIKQTSTCQITTSSIRLLRKCFAPEGNAAACVNAWLHVLPSSCYPAVAKLTNNNDNKQYETLPYTVWGEFCRKSNFGWSTPSRQTQMFPEQHQHNISMNQRWKMIYRTAVCQQLCVGNKALVLK